MYKEVPKYKDNLWYPILVRVGGGHKIVEMLGKQVNDYNNSVALRTNPRYNNIFNGNHND